ncbi:MAG: protein kinase [Chloroflexi bacterium]|nr:protein kinase [Chloroflexota bacterium]
MFDFSTGVWQPSEGTLIEVAVVPSEPTPPPHLALASPGLALVLQAAGGGSLAGAAGPSLVAIAAGDRVVLFPPDQFEIPLQVGGLTGTGGGPSAVRCRLVVAVADPAILAASVVQDEMEVTGLDVGRRLARDGAVRLAVQHALREDESALPTGIEKHTARSLLKSTPPPAHESALPAGIEKHLAEPLTLLFGLRLREVPSDVRVLAGSEASETFAPGQIVGDHWRLVRRLGRGAFGEVWLVENTAVQAVNRALKVVRHPALARAVNREAQRIVRLEREGLDWRHLARLFDVVPGDPPYLLYEYVQGQELWQHVATSGGRLAPEGAVEIVGQVLQGLAEVHRAGLVHRDLHPGNIIVTRQPDDLLVKILDFGLAWPTGAPAAVAGSAGGLSLEPSHPFAEPAWLRGGAPPDERTDLYSVGVLLWWLLTGQAGLPAGRSLEEAWPGGPRDLLAIVRKATDPNRQGRYGGAAKMLTALSDREPFVQSTGSQAAPTTRASRTPVAPMSQPNLIEPVVPSKPNVKWEIVLARLDLPDGIAVDKQDNLYVAESTRHRLRRFPQGGAFLIRWAQRSFRTDDLSWCPCAIAVDERGFIYVSDSGRSIVFMFSREGKPLTALKQYRERYWDGSHHSWVDLFCPQGVAVDVFGNVYVAQMGNHRITKFSRTGESITSWGRKGSAAGAMEMPTGVAVDSAGNVYVADAGNHRIQKFSPIGQPLLQVGQYGNGAGQLAEPHGIAVDVYGNIYVADTLNHRIQQFSPAGEPVAQWGSEGTGDWQFVRPHGIAVDSQGNIYVADTDNHRVVRIGRTSQR